MDQHNIPIVFELSKNLINIYNPSLDFVIKLENRVVERLGYGRLHFWRCYNTVYKN